MMAVQPPATTAGPSPKGMIRAPLPASDQPLPEMVDRLSRVVSSQRATPEPRPISTTRMANCQSRAESTPVGLDMSCGMLQARHWGFDASYIYICMGYICMGDLPGTAGPVVLLPEAFERGMPELER